MARAANKFARHDAAGTDVLALALLRASTDALLDPQVLLEAARDSSGQIVDFLYREINQATSDYLGLSRAELIGRGVVETMPGIRDTLLPGYIRCLDTGEPLILNDFAYDNEVLADTRRYDLRATRATSTSVVLTWRDVTERFLDIHRLAVSEQRYRLLAENAGDVVVHVRDGRFVWVSPSIEDLLGAPAEYWLGRDVREIIPPSDLAARAARLKTIAMGGVVKQRIQVIAVDGVTHWVHVHAKPFYDDDGRPDGSTGSLRLIDDEVAAQREAEEAHRQTARIDARYRRSIESSAVGMVMLAPDGRLLEVNDALCQLFGYDADTLKQKTWQELTAPEYLAEDQKKADDLLEGRIDSYRRVKQYLHADGHRIWGDLSVSCVRDENGLVEHFISQITDVTAQVQADERNRELTQRLQQQTKLLKAELASAATYMASIMPRGLQGRVTVSSRYMPSQALGGDCIDYYWIDDDHLLVKAIDVSGHGIEPALLAVSVHNLMRSGSLPRETVLSPAAVLAELNHRFPMCRHNDHYFTMWCGIYEASTRTLRYASGGAPPALALNSATGSAVTLTLLSTKDLPIGMFEDTEFTSRTYQVPPGCQILIYTDGASEITLVNGWQLTGSAFQHLISRVAASPDWSLDDLIEELRALTPSKDFEDDCTLIRLTFD